MAQRIIIPALNYDQQSIPSNPSVGQIWRERDSSNNFLGNWFWNGAYWLSTTLSSAQSSYVAAVSSSSGLLDFFTFGNNVFIADFFGYFFTQGDATNNWDWVLSRDNNAGSVIQIAVVNSFPFTSGFTGRCTKKTSINTYFSLDNTTAGAVSFRVNLNKILSPGVQYGNASLTYRIAR